MPRPAKFLHVAEKLQNRIEAGGFPAGEPLPPEQVLADEMGVHRLTLRKALSLLRERQVVIGRPGLGSFANSASHPAAIPSAFYIGETDTDFYQTFYQALREEARKRGLALMALSPEGEPDELRGRFREIARQSQGVICTTSAWEKLSGFAPEELRVTRVSGFDSVGSRPIKDRPGCVVSTDHIRAVSIAVSHLARLGHRRIALLDVGLCMDYDPDPLLGKKSWHHEALNGYRAGLHQAGLDGEILIVIPDVTFRSRDRGDPETFEERSIARHFEVWRERPTAVVVVGDFRAAALLRVLRRLELRVPEDISIVGLGNTPWCKALDPHLTSVCLGEPQMARLALILNGEGGSNESCIVRVDPELVVRESTSPANH